MAKKKTTKRKSTTKKKPAKKDTKALAKKEYTEEEKARIAKYDERKKRKSVKVKIVKSDSGEPQVTVEEPTGQLYEVNMLEALGTPDSDLQNRLLCQVLNTFDGTVSEGEFDKDKVVTAYNHTMAILSGIQPQDELEGMLAVQMIGVHNMAMEYMGKATRTDRVNFMSTYMNVATKSLRTFTAQMEALKKYRTGGQQKMIVEHVHVNEGGQAIVGTVNQGGGGNNKNHE
jgi:hypothetical protein